MNDRNNGGKNGVKKLPKERGKKSSYYQSYHTWKLFLVEKKKKKTRVGELDKD